MKVTLKDLAKNLGLSVMAVSKALRDAPDISSSTKIRVRQEAQRLGYTPNLIARHLRKGNVSKLIGLIVPSINNPIGSNLAAGLESECSSRGYGLIIGSSQDKADLEEKLFLKMVSQQVEAVFILPVVQLQHHSPLVDHAVKNHVPLVFFHRHPPNAEQSPQIGWVSADNDKAAELAVEHLANFGHRDILYLSGPLTASSASEHLLGFKKAMAEKLGIRETDEKIFMGGFRIESGEEAMTHALAEGVSFTGVVCVNDYVAIGACNVLKKNGVRIPEEISVVGFGNGRLGKYFTPSLTTIHQPQVEMARASFLLWEQSRKKGTALGNKILPVELMKRESSGKAP